MSNPMSVSFLVQIIHIQLIEHHRLCRELFSFDMHEHFLSDLDYFWTDIRKENAHDKVDIDASMVLQILNSHFKTGVDDFQTALTTSKQINDQLTSKQPVVRRTIDSDEDDEGFTMLMTDHNRMSKKRSALIPNDYDNDYEAIDNFVSEFAVRYGTMMPLFFIGTIDDAIRDALLCPAKDRKLLGIYLHSDNTIYCNIFCSTVLCNESVVNFLSQNFLVWPWDLTLAKNETKFYESCTRNLGSLTVNSLKNLKNKLPIFLIVTRTRGSNEILAIVEGLFYYSFFTNKL
jgi:hypothetical protein